MLIPRTRGGVLLADDPGLMTGQLARLRRGFRYLSPNAEHAYCAALVP
jgi:hypothetical protein